MDKPADKMRESGWTPLRAGSEVIYVFYLNEVKVLPERDLMPFKFDEDSPLKVLSDILGQWFYYIDPITSNGYYLKHVMSNRFELLQLLLGSGLGDGVYKVRDMRIAREEETVRLWLDDYELIRAINDDLDSFAKWVSEYGLATENDVRSLSTFTGGRGLKRLDVTPDL